jgi:hypothetical protein
MLILAQCPSVHTCSESGQCGYSGGEPRGQRNEFGFFNCMSQGAHTHAQVNTVMFETQSALDASSGVVTVLRQRCLQMRRQIEGGRGTMTPSTLASHTGPWRHLYCINGVPASSGTSLGARL